MGTLMGTGECLLILKHKSILSHS